MDCSLSCLEPGHRVVYRALATTGVPATQPSPAIVVVGDTAVAFLPFLGTLAAGGRVAHQTTEAVLVLHAGIAALSGAAALALSVTSSICTFVVVLTACAVGVPCNAHAAARTTLVAVGIADTLFVYFAIVADTRSADDDVVTLRNVIDVERVAASGTNRVETSRHSIAAGQGNDSVIDEGAEVRVARRLGLLSRRGSAEEIDELRVALEKLADELDVRAAFRVAEVVDAGAAPSAGHEKRAKNPPPGFHGGHCRKAGRRPPLHPEILEKPCLAS